MALSDPKTVQGIKSLVSATEVVNTYIKGVQQLDEDFTQHPDFKQFEQHVDEAKANAKYWQTQLYPLYKDTTSGILQASEFFSKTIHSLQTTLENTSYNEKTFELELNKLITSADTQQSKITEVIQRINTFSEEEAKILRNFHFDAEKVRVTIVGDQANLKALHKQLQGIEGNIVRDKALFAGAILIIWIAIAAGVALSNDNKAKAKVDGQIAAKNKEITNFTNFKMHLDKLNTAGESLAQAISEMQQGWDALRADIQEVIAKLKVLSSTEAVAYLRPLLDTAYKDWMDVVELAKKL